MARKQTVQKLYHLQVYNEEVYIHSALGSVFHVLSEGDLDYGSHFLIRKLKKGA